MHLTLDEKIYTLTAMIGTIKSDHQNPKLEVMESGYTIQDMLEGAELLLKELKEQQVIEQERVLGSFEIYKQHPDLPNGERIARLTREEFDIFFEENYKEFECGNLQAHLFEDGESIGNINPLTWNKPTSEPDF